jgi:hypothetical protein
LCFATSLLCLSVIVGSSASAAAASAPVTVSFSLNGRAVAHSSASNPVKLDPKHPAQVTLTVTNHGAAPITVQSVAISGRALDITFFDFETQIGMQVEPGGSATQQFTLDFAALNGQADGLIPASAGILDGNRHLLAKQGFTADVRGRITSLFGLFAIEVTIFTAILFIGALLALARGRLHENRFRRALRFMWPGLGLGIVIVFGGAILRIFVPSPGHWLPIVLICALVGFAVGFLTPHPGDDESEPEPEPDPTTASQMPYDPRTTVDPRTTLPATGAPVTQPPASRG